VNSTSLIKVSAVSLLLAGMSAAIPIRQITGMDPAMVFRGR
jgi:ABC-type antimicrobial peptide transport system permease subunit